MRLEMVYVQDTAKYLMFQISHKDVVGTIYLPKKLLLKRFPEELEILVLTPAIDEFLWKKRIEEMLLRVRGGSKAERKLKQALAKVEGD